MNWCTLKTGVPQGYRQILKGGNITWTMTPPLLTLREAFFHVPWKGRCVLNSRSYENLLVSKSRTSLFSAGLLHKTQAVGEQSLRLAFFKPFGMHHGAAHISVIIESVYHAGVWVMRSPDGGRLCLDLCLPASVLSTAKIASLQAPGSSKDSYYQSAWRGLLA